MSPQKTPAGSLDAFRRGIAASARGRRAIAHLPPGVMNRSEARYAAELERRRVAGELHLWAFEPLRLRIARDAFYTPDFLLWLADGTLELHEYKGHWTDAARLRVRVAAELHPWAGFLGVTQAPRREGGGYRFERFRPRDVRSCIPSGVPEK